LFNQRQQNDLAVQRHNYYLHLVEEVSHIEVPGQSEAFDQIHGNDPRGFLSQIYGHQPFLNIHQQVHQTI